MILYLDTSALVKLYIKEPGSDMVRAYRGRAQEIATSVVAYTEAYSAFRRAFRVERRITEEGFKEAIRKFENDWRGGGYTLVRVSDLVLETARDLILKHGLRGFDGIHLASALFLKMSREEIWFGAFDSRLTEAAEKEGLLLAFGENGGKPLVRMT
ncbi:type II toxin-antitoxin system VapC family toxin [Thermosulfurimonas sp. F29]|uniref:type II toxin-antitoxin system VapC family toxin n=1 Tax=Thermosulfurimonas sp. F29 TaxID=2867247 RepID=UPI001C8312AE|nr:type II toxin-antitoxin system VapC family toxin [Thermosulfurimonas sp. F29]MBX6422657.1 type II toxin-antitoxin system VapC family toxin [Thermosulfurimonas sp. F29]